MLKENLEKVFSEISKGNNLGEPVTLVGATKMVDAEIINQAVALGLKVVAENKVQEFNLKHDKIVGASQHFIGHLQTNKVKYLVGNVDVIQSVDTVHLASAIDVQAQKKGVIQDVLLEVNAGGEISKSGFSIEQVLDSAKEIANNFKSIKIKGLMAMLPHLDDQNELAKLCVKVRSLFDDLKQMGFDAQYLSMGMSNDYLTAINNGSNMIRLGSKIFGQRNYGENK